MFKHILVPVDGSPFAETAIPYAVSLASQYQGELTLLRVILPPRSSDGPLSLNSAENLVRARDDLYRDAIGYCRHQQATLGDRPCVIHYQVAESDDVAEEINRVARECGADTIVMSSHGRGGISRLLFGSVAARVLQTAAAPVLVVRPNEAETGQPRS